MTEYVVTEADIDFGQVPAGVTATAFVDASPLQAVTLDEFVAVDEPGAEPLVGDADEALIPENGDVMMYGDGGSGKTTLCVDLSCHLAAGDDWLGVRVVRPVRVLLVENEGPRPLFRRKLRRKRDGWVGSPLEDRLFVVEAPWARLTFADEACRENLARLIRELDVDVVIVGPVTRSGMNEAGTLQDVAEFMGLVADARIRSGRHVTVILVHHENKGGKVSGAWEGSGDTLFHVQGQGHGHTRLYIQKARWSSSHHATSMHLRWTDGDGFEIDDKPEIDDETLGDLILAKIRERPGATWGKIEEHTKGVNAKRRRDVRDGLLAHRFIFNVVTQGGVQVALSECPERKTAHLYAADDPTIAHLRPDPDSDETQTASDWGAGLQGHLRPASRPIGDADVDAPVTHPLEDDFLGAE